MKTLAIRFTRPDHATVPGGIILRVNENKFGHGLHEYVVHSFSRPRGSREPESFFWGHYRRDEESARAAFNDKVRTAERYDTGGSLIPVYDEKRELEKELEHERT